MSGYAERPNKQLSAANGIDYAYRDTGGGGTPLVVLQHFRGNLDYWDPVLIDALSSSRRVVAFETAERASAVGNGINQVEGSRAASLRHVLLTQESVEMRG
jgi:hypothetical protein